MRDLREGSMSPASHGIHISFRKIEAISVIFTEKILGLGWRAIRRLKKYIKGPWRSHGESAARHRAGGKAQEPGGYKLQAWEVGGAQGKTQAPKKGEVVSLRGTQYGRTFHVGGNITRTNCSWQVVIYCQDNAKRYWKQKKRGSPACVGADS